MGPAVDFVRVDVVAFRKISLVAVGICPCFDVNPTGVKQRRVQRSEVLS
jgi:hypothetical protein